MGGGERRKRWFECATVSYGWVGGERRRRRFDRGAERGGWVGGCFILTLWVRPGMEKIGASKK